MNFANKEDFERFKSLSDYEEHYGILEEDKFSLDSLRSVLYVARSLESELEAIKKESLLLLNGFLESKVAEKCNEMEKELSAARKVVQAGAELIKRAELMCGYKHNPGDPPAIIQLKDLELALAAYDRVKGDK